MISFARASEVVACAVDTVFVTVARARLTGLCTARIAGSHRKATSGFRRAVGCADSLEALHAGARSLSCPRLGPNAVTRE